MIGGEGELQGITPRAFDHIFSTIDCASDKERDPLTCSRLPLSLELYALAFPVLPYACHLGIPSSAPRECSAQTFLVRASFLELYNEEVNKCGIA